MWLHLINMMVSENWKQKSKIGPELDSPFIQKMLVEGAPRRRRYVRNNTKWSVRGKHKICVVCQKDTDLYPESQVGI